LSETQKQIIFCIILNKFNVENKIKYIYDCFVMCIFVKIVGSPQEVDFVPRCEFQLTKRLYNTSFIE